MNFIQRYDRNKGDINIEQIKIIARLDMNYGVLAKCHNTRGHNMNFTVVKSECGRVAAYDVYRDSANDYIRVIKVFFK